MRSSFWVALGLVGMGIIILLLPEDDSRVFSLNESHGPSLQDMVGIIFILVTWIWLLSKVITRNKMVTHAIGRRGILFSVLGIVTGTLVIAQGLINKQDILLITGITLSVIGYGLLIVPAFRK